MASLHNTFPCIWQVLSSKATYKSKANNEAITHYSKQHCTVTNTDFLPLVTVDRNMVNSKWNVKKHWLTLSTGSVSGLWSDIPETAQKHQELLSLAKTTDTYWSECGETHSKTERKREDFVEWKKTCYTLVWTLIVLLTFYKWTILWQVVVLIEWTVNLRETNALPGDRQNRGQGWSEI